MKASNRVLRHFAESVTEISLNENDIITGGIGFENFKNLTNLNLDSNKKIVDSDLKKLNKLKTLSMSNLTLIPR